MSSDEDTANPIVPKDSDQGSSVSSDLQDEYEELLRYAVVIPKLNPEIQCQSQHNSQLSANGQMSGTSHGIGSVARQENGQLNGRELTTAVASEELPAESVTESESVETSRKSSLDDTTSALTTMFISEENMSTMENILDTWSNNLKDNVMAELQKWKLTFAEQHNQELKKEREKQVACVVHLNAELNSLKELLQTYEISNQRKDEVIGNLTKGLEQQREKLALMKSFTHWRQQHLEVKEEAHGHQVAEQHYHLQLKRKVWTAWHSLIQIKWQEKVENACQAQAEQVCLQVSADYEARLAEHVQELQKARAEIQRLYAERERYEGSMKKAFMRGVCALNMEAMSIFQGSDHDLFPPRDEHGPASRHQTQSSQYRPLHFDSSSPPSCSDTEQMPQVTSQTALVSGVSRAVETGTSATIGYTPVPQESASIPQKLISSRVVSSSQHNAAKTITARITARNINPRTSRASSNLQSIGVAPPMSSIIVERHHPVTQLTVSQAAAAKYPRSSQHSLGLSNGRGSDHNPKRVSSSHIHSIKLVE